MIGRRLSLHLSFNVLWIAALVAGQLVLLAPTAARAVSPERVNLAAADQGGRIVSVTDEYSDYPASRLIDGDRLDYGEWWSHENPSFPQKIVFALGVEQPTFINEVVLNPWTSEWRTGWVKDFEVYVSADNPNLARMRRVGSFTLEHVGVDQSFSFDPVRAKYIGLVIASNYGSTEGVGLSEFEVYAASPVDIADSAAASSDPDNLAAAANGGRIVACSSEDANGKWPAERLIDGRTDTATGWSSAEDLNRPQFVVFAFQGDRRRLVDRVTLNAHSANFKEDWIQDFELRGSDGETDVDAMTSLGRFRLTQTAVDQTFTIPPVSLRYLALVPLSNFGGTAYALNEFAVYRAAAAQTEPGIGARVAERPATSAPTDDRVIFEPVPPRGATAAATPAPTPTSEPAVVSVDNIDVKASGSDLVPAVYHLYGPFFDSLVKTELTNHNPRTVKLRVEATINHYTETDIQTITLGPGESATVEQNPPLTPAAFGLLAEDKNAARSLRVDYLQEGERKVVYEGTAPIKVYARGSFPWNIPGFHNGTLFLATMVTPNDPAVDALLRAAADYTPDGTIVTGYHSDDDADHEVWNRMKAIYEAVAKDYQVTYVAAGVDFVPQTERDHGFTLQRLKWPREVLESHSGMCVEVSTLFASAFEAIGLRPIIITVPGHVYVAVPIAWDSNTYYVLEGTMVGRYSFEDAVHKGNEEFMDEAKAELDKDQMDNYFWLDVSEVREEGILPLPWR